MISAQRYRFFHSNQPNVYSGVERHSVVATSQVENWAKNIQYIHIHHCKSLAQHWKKHVQLQTLAKNYENKCQKIMLL